MLEGKKGLRLLSLSILIQIIWAVVAVIVYNQFNAGKESLANFANLIPVITLGLLIFCYLLDFAGLRIAGHDSDRFRKAWKLKILSLLLTIFSIIFAIIATNKGDEGLVKTSGTIVMVANIVSAVVEVLVVLLVAKGCADLAPRAQGLSKLVLGLFFIDTILVIVGEILLNVANKNGDEKLTAAVSYMGLAFVIVAALFAILYILLIFKATRTAGKSRR